MVKIDQNVKVLRWEQALMYSHFLDPTSTNAASCDNAFEEAVKLWYNQIKGYSFAAPSLDSDTDTFTQVCIVLHCTILYCNCTVS